MAWAVGEATARNRFEEQVQQSGEGWGTEEHGGVRRHMEAHGRARRGTGGTGGTGGSGHQRSSAVISGH